MELPDIDAFLECLYEAGAELGWDFPGHYTSPASRDARTQMRAGLSRLRDGQEQFARSP